MLRYTKSVLILAVALAVLGGYVDAFGYLSLGGYFVSFMSGNSTKLGIAISHGNGAAVLKGGCVIAVFVGGACLGELVRKAAKANRARPVLLTVMVLIAVSALAHNLGHNRLCIGLLILSMGAVNASVQRDGALTIGLTYMTGTLVKTGQQVAATLTNGPRFDWIPYLLLWAGLVTGAA